MTTSGPFNDHEHRHVPHSSAGEPDVQSARSDREIAVAVDMLPSAALIYDRDDGTIRHANPVFEQMTGITNDDFVGHCISEFYRDSEEHDEFLARLFIEGAVSGRQVRGTTGDDAELWLDTSSRWVVYGGRPAVLTLFTNIDAEKRAQLASEEEKTRISRLGEISAIIARQRPGDEMFERVSAVVKRLVPFDRIGIALTDPEYGTFSLIFVRGTELSGRNEGEKIQIGQSMNSVVARTGQSLVMNDLDSPDLSDDIPSLAVNRDAGIRSLVTVPMTADDRIVGTISLRSKQPGTYDDDAVEVVGRVASLVAPALEQARLYKNLERESHERRILAEIGRVISSSPDVSDVYGKFSELVREILPADRLVVTALEEPDDKFVILYRSGVVVDDKPRGRRLPSTGSLMPLVTETRNSVLFRPTDITEVERQFPVLVSIYKAGLRSFLSVPLFVGDRIVGSIQFFSNSENDYRRRDVQLAEAVASQIAGAVASSLLRDAEKQTATENAALAEIGRTITSATDIRPIFDRFGELVGNIVPCDRLVVMLVDTESDTATDTFVYGTAVPEWKEGTVHEMPAATLRAMFEERRIQYSPDISRGFESAPNTRDIFLKAGLRSSLLVPLWSSGELIGCLSFSSTQEAVYTPHYIELAERVSDQVAGAIGNARLYRDLQDVADERRALASIALAATQNLDLQGVFARAADSLHEVVDYERMSITLIDPDDETLRVAFTSGESDEGIRVGDVVEPVEGDPFDGESWTWESGLGLGARDDGRLRAMMQVPLGSHPRLLGYIRLRSHTADAYNEGSIEMLERVATYLTPAVQNALEYSREKRLAAERERTLLLDHENRELQRISEAKSQFLTTVTHELKTPLTSITAFTNILLKNRRGNLGDKDLSQLVVIQRNNRRLKNLIDDLLDLSQIDQDGLSLTHSEFDAGDFLSELVDGFRPISDAKSQPITVSMPGRPVGIRADRDRLAQVMTNLLSNASKYSPDRSEIAISARRWRDRLYFSVADRGIGISEEDRKSLFSLFFRADNEETRSVPGTGIGLYIVKTIIDLHHGKIEAKAPVGGGTAIEFYVPGAFSADLNSAHPKQESARVIPWSRMDDIRETEPDEASQKAI